MKGRSKAASAFLFGSLVFLYLHLFILPHTPVFAWGDQSIFLHDARRMLDGDVIYRDFFEFTFPGTPLLYFGLFKVWGPRAWIPDFMLLAMGVGLAWLGTVIAKSVMKGAVAFLPALLFLVLPFRSILDGTHHWYSVLAVTAALAILMDSRSTRRIALAGILCGLATCFTQSRGPMAALGILAFLAWERRQNRESWRWLLNRALCLFGTFFATVAIFNAYFIWKAGLARFLYCTVVFVFKYYPSERYNNWRAYLRFSDIPHITPWSKPLEGGIWVAIHGLIPFIYALALVYVWRRKLGTPLDIRARLVLLNVFGVFLFLGVAPSPGYARLCSVSLPGFISLVWCLDGLGRFRVALLRLLCVAMLALAAVEVIDKQTHWRREIAVPTGRTAYLDAKTFDKFNWMAEHTEPGEYVFGDQLLCFALGVRDPAEIAFITNDEYTRPEQVRNLVEALQTHRAKFVLWYAGLDSSPSSSDHLGPLRFYLRTYYHPVQRFANLDQVMERNDERSQ